MSILNPRSRSAVPSMTVNAEGHEVYTEEPQLELFKLASNLKAQDTFYKDEKERIADFLHSVDRVSDKEYVKSLAWFLNGLGLKLSPVVMTTHINRSLSAEDSATLARIWDRPDKIAVSIGMEKHLGTRLAPSFKKKVLKRALERFKAVQLKKMRMENRSIKLKDLIKLLHPKPKDAETAKLYKAIIESSKESKLTASESFIAAKSDKDLSEDVKLKMLAEGVETIPINMLVRNLRFYEKMRSYGDKTTFKTKVVKRLNAALTNREARLFNPFDLITVAIEVPALRDEMLAVIESFNAQVKERSGFSLDGRTAILFDVSGSMGGEGQKVGFKYAVLFTMLLDLKDQDIFKFDTSLYKTHEVAKAIRAGDFNTANAAFNQQGGTSLVDSFHELVTQNPDIRNVIVISDEVTWADEMGVQELDRRLRAGFAGNVIVVNPVAYGPTVFRSKMLALASLDAKILYYLQALTNFKSFAAMLKDEYKNASAPAEPLQGIPVVG